MTVPEPLRRPTTAFSPPPAPKHLSEEAAALWASVASDFALESHHLSILERACEQLDALRLAQAAVSEHGALVEGRFGPRPNPAVAMARDATTLYMRALRELGLDFEPPTNQQRTAAAREARWTR